MQANVGISGAGGTGRGNTNTPGGMNPFEGQQIRIAGHWKVLKKIGSGAFGDIYLGIYLN